MNLLTKQLILILFLSIANAVLAQNNQGIYVDASGVIRWQKNHQEAAFFGANYTVPFAYGYRAVKRVGLDPEQAIKDDVYHFSRLGFDAFRVHVWDQEIADSAGNLLNNEHLRLFDFLIAELKKRKIKILITPIAFWGNGYPEKDENTNSFSYRYGKQRALTTEDAFKAQENYLRQFFRHKNQYTGLTYQNDVDILATEVNNEPQHSGLKELATSYINRMVAAIKSAGWTKPVFYNISESPWYADAIVKSNVQGHSFQWYPTGLVAGHTLKGNYLPNVAHYRIPFDSIPAFKNRAKIVYEFDAGDVMQPIMYPAMARSFKSAGFQWATQFAYDPMSTAHANTEYQTHYLNMAFTPAKAISMLIASKIFHQQPRSLEVTDYHSFGPVKLDYQHGLSEMNSNEEFYYSNSTSSVAINAKSLKHVAGVGSSSVVNYEGNGAYFIDQVADGIWRLEVMPDAVQISDPFAKASPKKTVTRMLWNMWPMAINLPNLGDDFTVKALNNGNQAQVNVLGTKFNISPGVYLLVRKNQPHLFTAKSRMGNIVLGEFVAPKNNLSGITVRHEPLPTISSLVPFQLTAQITGLVKGDEPHLQLVLPNARKSVPLRATAAYQFTAVIPEEWLQPGLLKYQIVIKRTKGKGLIFPENESFDPEAWDRLESASYQTYISAKDATLEIFNPERDGKYINVYNSDWKNHKVDFPSGENPMQLSIKLSMDEHKSDQLMGFQSYFADKTLGRQTELTAMKMLVLKMRSNVDRVKVKVGLVDINGQAFSTTVDANANYRLVEIPLNQLKPDEQLLLPRPYPGFLPLYYRPANTNGFKLKDAEKVEVTFGYGKDELPKQIFIETIYLK